MSFKARCRVNWEQMRYSDPEILKHHIVEIFEENTDQHCAMTGVYRLLIPDWDDIEKLVGYPEAGTKLWRFICQQCQAFDRKHHPRCMPGGAWLNFGFSSNPELPEWGIGFDKCSPIYQRSKEQAGETQR